LGGSSLSTTASTSPFSSSLFGPGGLFGNTSSVLATPSEPPPKSEAEKKKEFDERMKKMGLFQGISSFPTDNKSTDVASSALGSFSNILNLSVVPEVKQKTDEEKKKEFDARMASVFGKKAWCSYN